MSSATFARNSTAYNPETGELVAINTPRFVEGPFPGSRALFVEEGATNLVNPAWNPVKDDQYETIVATGETKMGRPIYQSTKKTTGAPPVGLYGPFDIANNASFAATVYIKDLQVPALDPSRLLLYKSDVGVLAYDVANTVNAWERLAAVYTNTTGATITGVYAYYYPSRQVGDITLFSCPQVQANNYPTSFCWNSRIADDCHFPTAGILSPIEGTWEQWVYIDVMARRTGQSSAYNRIFDVLRASDNDYCFAVWHEYNSANWKLTIRDDGVGSKSSSLVPDSLTPDGWHLFSVPWSAPEAVLFIDGVRRAAIVSPPHPSAYTDAYIGRRGGSTGRWLNTAHAGVRISSRARTDEEILAVYQSGDPLQVDADTTYLLPLNGDLLNLANQGGSVTRLAVGGIGVGRKEAWSQQSSIGRVGLTSHGSGLAIKQGGRLTGVSLATLSGHGLPIKQGGSLSSLLLHPSGQGMKFRATRGRTSILMTGGRNEILVGGVSTVDVIDSKREVALT